MTEIACEDTVPVHTATKTDWLNMRSQRLCSDFTDAELHIAKKTNKIIRKGHIWGSSALTLFKIAA